MSFGGHTMSGRLRRVVVKRPEEAFGSQAAIDAQWQAAGYHAPPRLQAAAAEHEAFVDILEQAGAEVLTLPAGEGTDIDSLYAHDPVLITDGGAVLLRTGKPSRRHEGAAAGRALEFWDIPILGEVSGAGTAEAGDMAWLDARTLLVGRGFRTNGTGVAMLRDLLAPLNVEVVDAALAYWNGPGEVLHLLSVLSPVDDDLAVVYRRLLPVPVWEQLQERGVQVIDVPDEEFATLGCNVLALAPRRVVMVEDNPQTEKALEAAGCEVTTFSGAEICRKGDGGPTCLTRPLLRTIG